MEKYVDLMRGQEDLKRLENESTLWQAYPLKGDSVRPPKETVIQKLGRLAASKDRSNPHEYNRIVSGLIHGHMTPEDVLTHINMSWKEMIRHA